MPVIVIVTGSRNAEEASALQALGSFLALLDQAPELWHGGCPTGVDSAASKLARLRRIDLKVWPADWNKHGRRAGPVRNWEMISSAVGRRAQGEEVHVLALPANGEENKGTMGTVELALKASLNVSVQWVKRIEPGVIPERVYV